MPNYYCSNKDCKEYNKAQFFPITPPPDPGKKPVKQVKGGSQPAKSADSSKSVPDMENPGSDTETLSLVPETASVLPQKAVSGPPKVDKAQEKFDSYMLCKRCKKETGPPLKRFTRAAESDTNRRSRSTVSQRHDRGPKALAAR